MSDVRNPIWRKGGIVFPPTPRDYSFSLPKKVAKGALREALAFKVQAGAVRVVEALSVVGREDEGRRLDAQGPRRHRQDADRSTSPSTRRSICRRATSPACRYVAANRVSAPHA